MEGVRRCFAGLQDPRPGNAGRHDLLVTLLIALCTVLCGGENRTDMAEFAQATLEFLRGFLKLEHGAPSNDTFSRVLRLRDPEQLGGCFQRFTADFAEACQGVVAIDGKVLCRPFDKAAGRSALHMASAWGCEQHLVLGRIAADAKSNEITAVPKLLKLRSLAGCTVTVDAFRCQRVIGQQIVDQAGDYVLALKDNQPILHADVKMCLDAPKSQVSTANPVVDADQGGIETRTATVSTDIDWLHETHHGPVWRRSAS